MQRAPALHYDSKEVIRMPTYELSEDYIDSSPDMINFDEAVMNLEDDSRPSRFRNIGKPSARSRIEAFFEMQRLREDIYDPVTNT
jgi:hypothetical protein